MYKELLIFVGGVALGAASMFFAVRKHYEAIANEEIEDMREHFEAKYARNSENKAKIEPHRAETDDEEPLEPTAIPTERRFVRHEAVRTVKNNEQEANETVENANNEDPRPSRPAEPYVVTDDVADYFNHTMETYTFSYYNGSDTFINEDNTRYNTTDKDEEIEDIDYYIGSDLHQKLLQNLPGDIIEGRRLYNSEVIRIRNESIYADIEIVWYEAEYEEE